jgi:hypothetical protein
MRIVPVRPNDSNGDGIRDAVPVGAPVAARPTYGRRLPSHRLFGRKIPSHRLFGRKIPSHRLFGRKIP